MALSHFSHLSNNIKGLGDPLLHASESISAPGGYPDDRKPLDAFSHMFLAIGFELLSTQNAEYTLNRVKVTLLVRTGKALRVDSLGGSSPAFHLRPGTQRQRR